MRRLIVLVLFLLQAVAAQADERIASFKSDVTINAEASLDVTETIVWQFENVGPKRGILRDFPTRYRDHNGLNVRIGFDVLSVTRDGHREPFALEAIDNGTRVRIGDKDVYLSGREATYIIAYRTTRQLGFFKGYDELYWNVTGNAWTMPILKAEAIIQLPPGAKVTRQAGYTGPQGSAGADYRVIESDGQRFRAETTRALNANEGFTIAAGFTKGVVAAPSSADRTGWYLRDNAGFFALLLGLLGVSGFYLHAWNRAGRDPPEGTIIPLFAPPDGLGPAGVRYVWRQSFDDKTFAAALVGLAVKGRVKIHDSGDGFSVDKLGAEGPGLTATEQRLYAALPGGGLAFEQENHQKVRAMRSSLQGALDQEFDGVAFLLNRGWFWLGLGLSLAVLLLTVVLMPGEDRATGFMAAAWTGIWWAAILWIGGSVVRGLFAKGLSSKLGAMIVLTILLPFVVAGVLAPMMMFTATPSMGLLALVAGAVLLAGLNGLFFYLLKAPTLQGRKLLDQIEGFRMYMTIAEEDRLNALTPPTKTPELFEKYLPYALALDCENEWNAKFAAVLAAAALAAPAWYAGSHWDSGDLGGFTDSIGTSLASSTASASSAPGKSSGSDGGGSSGGGGGGGGGSSW